MKSRSFIRALAMIPVLFWLIGQTAASFAVASGTGMGAIAGSPASGGMSLVICTPDGPQTIADPTAPHGSHPSSSTGECQFCRTFDDPALLPAPVPAAVPYRAAEAAVRSVLADTARAGLGWPPFQGRAPPTKAAV